MSGLDTSYLQNQGEHSDAINQISDRLSQNNYTSDNNQYGEMDMNEGYQPDVDP